MNTNAKLYSEIEKKVKGIRQQMAVIDRHLNYALTSQDVHHGHLGDLDYIIQRLAEIEIHLVSSDSEVE